MAIWKISPGRNANMWEEALSTGTIFIGWSQMGDLKKFQTQNELVKKYQNVYQVDYNPKNDSFALWAFSHLIKVGDTVIANRGSEMIVGIGVVKKTYEYRPEQKADYPNFIEVEWKITQNIKLSQKIFPRKTLSEIEDKSEKMSLIYQAIVEQVANGDQLWIQTFGTKGRVHTPVNSKIERTFVEEFQEYVRHRKFQFSRDILERFIFSLTSKPFVILTGISGTGKTKIAQLFAEFMSQRKPSIYTTTIDEDMFEYTLYPYNFKYQRLILPKSLEEQIELSEIEKGQTITLHFNNVSEAANIKREPRGHIRLIFRKGFMAWFKENFKVGETIVIKIRSQGQDLHFAKHAKEEQPTLPRQYAFVPVRPDWHDHRGLIGYYNPITETYHATDAVKVMLRAHRYPEDPFFLILDEMNLAKVEHYFSDFLSCLESRRMNMDGQLEQESIVLHDEEQEIAQRMTITDDDGTIYNVPPRIEIPQNLYIIGTVNIDETTHMFSPKVLDRTHVIEYNEIDFSKYRQTIVAVEASDFEWSLDYESRKFWFTYDGSFHENLYLKQYMNWQDDIGDVGRLFEWVERLHALMVREGFPFGYRVFDEMFTYTMDHREFGSEEYGSALDAAILQKILPKLHGNRTQMYPLLNEIIKLCQGEEGSQNDEKLRFPRTEAKLQAMKKQLERTGYCSFIQ